MAPAEVDQTNSDRDVLLAAPDIDGTVEAVQAVVRAAIDVGRQVLDAVERALDDPATAAKVAEVVAGLQRMTEGLRPTPAEAPADARGLERIEVS